MPLVPIRDGIIIGASDVRALRRERAKMSVLPAQRKIPVKACGGMHRQQIARLAFDITPNQRI